MESRLAIQEGKEMKYSRPAPPETVEAQRFFGRRKISTRLALLFREELRLIVTSGPFAFPKIIE